MFTKITDPKTGRKISIYRKKGMKILRNYLKQIGGHNGPCSINTSTGRCKKSDKWEQNKCEISKKGNCMKKKNKLSKFQKISNELHEILINWPNFEGQLIMFEEGLSEFPHNVEIASSEVLVKENPIEEEKRIVQYNILSDNFKNQLSEAEKNLAEVEDSGSIALEMEANDRIDLVYKNANESGYFWTDKCPEIKVTFRITNGILSHMNLYGYRCPEYWSYDDFSKANATYVETGDYKDMEEYSMFGKIWRTPVFFIDELKSIVADTKQVGLSEETI